MAKVLCKRAPLYVSIQYLCNCAEDSFSNTEHVKVTSAFATRLVKFNFFFVHNATILLL